ncbi:MAG: hypothetical protein JSS27_20600 [Planctomycetes bacterium]|nr:hypothetical protein [Planctomycetota bacterium]
MSRAAMIVLLCSCAAPSLAQQPAPAKEPQVAIKFEIIEVPAGTVKGLTQYLPANTAQSEQLEGDTVLSAIGVVENSSPLFTEIDTLRRKQTIKVLAAPQVLTRSGRTAVVRSGGEIPVPQAGPNKSFTFENKPVGLEAKVTPEVKPGGEIALAVHLENNEARYDAGLRVNGISVPKLHKMAVNANCELPPGKTLVLAGVSRQSIEQAEKPKLLGKLLPRKGAKDVETIVLVRAHVEPNR